LLLQKNDSNKPTGRIESSTNSDHFDGKVRPSDRAKMDNPVSGVDFLTSLLEPSVQF